MKSPNPVNLPRLEDKTFILLLVAVSLAFAWILWPFFAAVLWGIILAIVFAPLDRRLRGIMGQRRTYAALATVAIVLLIVILPLILIGGLLLQEAFGLYEKFAVGRIQLRPVFSPGARRPAGMGKRLAGALWLDQSRHDAGKTVRRFSGG